MTYYTSALDPDSTVKTVDLAGGMEELKRRTEVLLATRPDDAIDESGKAAVEREAEPLVLRGRVESID